MKAIHLRFLDEELHKAIEKSAKRNHRSLNGEILRAIELYLDEEKWDQAFEGSQEKLVHAAREARKQIEQGKSKPMKKEAVKKKSP